MIYFTKSLDIVFSVQLAAASHKATRYFVTVARHHAAFKTEVMLHKYFYLTLAARQRYVIECNATSSQCFKAIKTF